YLGVAGGVLVHSIAVIPGGRRTPHHRPRFWFPRMLLGPRAWGDAPWGRRRPYPPREYSCSGWCCDGGGQISAVPPCPPVRSPKLIHGAATRRAGATVCSPGALRNAAARPGSGRDQLHGATHRRRISLRGPPFLTVQGQIPGSRG